MTFSAYSFISGSFSLRRYACVPSNIAFASSLLEAAFLWPPSAPRISMAADGGALQLYLCGQHETRVRRVSADVWRRVGARVADVPRKPWRLLR